MRLEYLHTTTLLYINFSVNIAVPWERLGYKAITQGLRVSTAHLITHAVVFPFGL